MRATFQFRLLEFLLLGFELTKATLWKGHSLFWGNELGQVLFWGKGNVSGYFSYLPPSFSFTSLPHFSPTWACYSCCPVIPTIRSYVRNCSIAVGSCALWWRLASSTVDMGLQGKFRIHCAMTFAPTCCFCEELFSWCLVELIGEERAGVVRLEKGLELSGGEGAEHVLSCPRALAVAERESTRVKIVHMWILKELSKRYVITSFFQNVTDEGIWCRPVQVYVLNVVFALNAHILGSSSCHVMCPYALCVCS